MAIVDILSTLERTLALLTSNLGPLNRVGTEPSLIYSLSTLAASNLGTVAPASIGSSSSSTALQAAFPLTEPSRSSVSALSLMSFTPLGAIGGLFSDDAPRVPLQIQRQQDLGQQSGQRRELGLDSMSDFGQTIDRNSFGEPRILPDTYQTRMPTQITVNVQTIDSRSFLDHSEDIAQALRRSLLTNNPLREVL